MIDLVTANEFTFTPSAFIAAFIEQETSSAVTETTANGGTLTVAPTRNLEDVNSTFTINTTSGTHYGLPISVQTEGTVVTESYDSGSKISATFVPGGSGVTSGFTVSGALQDILGQGTTDNRTTSKTTTTSSGVDETVVLVLSYGQFRSKCVNAQSTVTLIYTRVAEYLNSLV